jgi:8-oxo-dGTP pyrophosphatase MutT (NUDIX family)
MIKLSTAGLILIKDKKLLLAFSKNKKAWYLPGGKVDANESSVEAIQREIKEELNLDIDPVGLKFYCHITVQAYGEQQHLMMEQDCFLYETNGEITPNNEIEAIAYFDRGKYLKNSAQVEGVLKVFDHLEQDGLCPGI